MPMPPYQLYCYTKDCKNPAKYKIAARWSDGVVSELKTYGLCCEECVAKWFQRGRQRFQSCKLLPGEIAEPPGIFVLQHGQRDKGLQRASDLEAKLVGKANTAQ